MIYPYYQTFFLHLKFQYNQFTMLKRLLPLLFFQLLPSHSFAQIASIKRDIEHIIGQKKVTIGVAVINLKNNDTFVFNDKIHFPMQSVYKFHLAMNVLNEVDKGKFSLSKKIFVAKNDLRPNTWSPLREKYPDGNVNIPLSEILSYTVSQSDNNGCDILFRLMGGPKKVQKYIHDLGIKETSIVATEEEMSRNWEVQYTNWTTPLAAAQLLKKMYNGRVLSTKSRDFLWRAMVETTTGPNKLKGQLTKNVIIGHKTGYSGTNEAGLTGATNDIGIIQLPNGEIFAIAVFVSNSMENEKTNDRIIADIAKATCDYFDKVKMKK